MSEVKWIKLYLDMFAKPKINKIRRLPDGDKILLFWVMLLATAGKCNAGGMIFITERVPFTEEDFADEFKFEINTVKLALKAFSELGMISIDDEGFIDITNWEEYQSADKLAELREKDRDRKRIKRAQQKNALSEGVRGQSTDSPSIEEDRDGDKEKELHSFIQPGDAEEREASKRRYLGGSLGKGVVLLSDEQIDSLLDELSIEEFNHYVEVIADCELQGKSFKKKTHYQAILDMAMKDRKKAN